jgi:Protein of unknown function (DUF2637)
VAEPSKTNDGHSPAETAAAMAVAIGIVLLVLIGFAASYATLRDLAVSAGRFSPWLAPVVPLSFDLGIVVLSLKIVLAANEGRCAIWLRLLVAGLSAATVAANASAAPTLIGRLLHAIPPAMFVICFESVTGSARREALRPRGANVTVPSVQPMLLVLAPLTTLRLWRRQLLREQQPEEPEVPEADPELGSTEANVTTSTPERIAPGGTLHRQAVADGRTGDGDSASRLRCAEAALRADPDLTAATLAGALRARGHACSVRTAQRVKARALASIRSHETLGSEDAA